ncbi:stage III sporulation protein AF [Pontibacillus litoralis]|uniref:Stage III sporulation protein AF n=1 Tax=Pontibacillus litoralis JSM 072002 TaxID=1385512 RepID=A0A0A5G9W4_9BACI|nr:stage III sporulation protein AF [Pontibacillus litoralis]KGX88844.1 stage III sporulation protein AF [Pontibacillus litoralis JSM 072002]
MDYLISWVTQIILFLLLALVSDLLLPSSQFRKYTKMVVGLLLILIFLQPIFHLFQTDMNQVLSEQMMSWNQEMEVEEMENLIEVKKSEIQASQRAYILEEMAVQLENKVKEGLMNEHEVAIQDFSFQFTTDQEIGFETLEQLSVVLSSNVGETQQGRVEDVEYVSINVQERNQQQVNQPSTKHVREFLADEWQIPKEKIDIQWEGGVE